MTRASSSLDQSAPASMKGTSLACSVGLAILALPKAQRQ